MLFSLLEAHKTCPSSSIQNAAPPKMSVVQRRKRAIDHEDLRQLDSEDLKVQVATEEEPKDGGAHWMKDGGSLALLLLLYTLQGIPMGLSGSIPFLLQKRISWTQQGTFSMVTWPFSLKLFWAPLVDAVYVDAFGRRKSWLVPVQFLCGGLMIWGQYHIDAWLGEVGEEGNGEDASAEGAVSPNIQVLTIYFFGLFFLMATQDIAVDGWALTMLSRENRGLASTVNTVGQTLGFFTAYVGFLALNDADTCNRYFRAVPQEEGIVSLGGFMAFWGYVFLFTTLYVVFLKREKPCGHDECADDIIGTYKGLWKVLQLPSVQQLCIVLLTCRAAFAAADAATSLKIVEYGMPKEELAFFTTLLGSAGVFLPALLGKLVAGHAPLTSWRWAYPLRLLVGILYGLLIPLSGATFSSSSEHPSMEGLWLPGLSLSKTAFAVFLVIAVLLHQVVSTAMFVSQMAFFAHISDPAMGGTYMTLLNTISNLGSKWPNMASLYLMDPLSKRQCLGVTSVEQAFRNGEECFEGRDEWCGEIGGTCRVTRDGYFVQLVICTVLGILWFATFSRSLSRIQGMKDAAWRFGGSAAAK